MGRPGPFSTFGIQNNKKQSLSEFDTASCRLEPTPDHFLQAPSPARAEAPRRWARVRPWDQAGPKVVLVRGLRENHRITANPVRFTFDCRVATCCCYRNFLECVFACVGPVFAAQCPRERWVWLVWWGFDAQGAADNRLLHRTKS